jgi:hypothetical protein
MTDELWGIDDPKERRRIDRAAKSRFSSIGPLLLSMLLVGIVGVVIMRLLRPYFPSTATADFVGIVVAVYVPMAWFGRWEVGRSGADRSPQIVGTMR